MPNGQLWKYTSDIILPEQGRVCVQYVNAIYTYSFTYIQVTINWKEGLWASKKARRGVQEDLDGGKGKETLYNYIIFSKMKDNNPPQKRQIRKPMKHPVSCGIVTS